MSKASDAAYRFIRSEILSGSLGPGAALREQALAAASGLSRTPVREALRKLEAERLVHRHDGRSSVVATLSADDIAEAFMLRGMLEGHAAARAATRATPAQIAEMAEHNEVLGQAISGAAIDVAAFIVHNRAFHTVLTAAACSERLAAMLATVVEPPIVLRTARHYDREAVERSHADHAELLAAFGRRDARWAQAVMTAHIRRAFHAYDDAVRRGNLTASDSPP